MVALFCKTMHHGHRTNQSRSRITRTIIPTAVSSSNRIRPDHDHIPV